MSVAPGPLSPGLYLVATPIGTARDITLRALDILRDADLLLAEDTRNLRKLMEIHGIALGGRQIWAYHDHNGAQVRPGIVARVREGAAVAFASDAGTPLIADPGYDLARAMTEEGLYVTTAPGPSAPLVALSLSGLPTDRFLFAGFLPPTASAREAALADLRDTPATLVFFESAKRCSSTVNSLLSVLGNRQAAICRELTKKFEEVRRGDLDHLAQGLADDPLRGEVVIVVDRDRAEASAADMEGALREALSQMRVKEAADMVAEAYGARRRDVYQMALQMKDDD